MKSFIFAIGVLLFLAAGIAVYWAFIQIPMPEIAPTHAIKKLYSTSLGNYIYLRRETRGLNYEKTAITASADSAYEPNPEVDYIFDSSSVPLFYFVKQDTLIIYSGAQVSVPPHTLHNFKLKVIELGSADAKKLKAHFREQGLGMF